MMGGNDRDEVPASPRPGGAGGPIRALLVDDDPLAAERAVAELRRSLGSVVATCVHTPETFGRALVSGDWDVILSDHRLPAFSATAALAALQATGRDIPFVILSGVIAAEEAAAAMRLGARDVVTKGDLGRLGALVEREVREAAVRRELRESERAREHERAERELVAGQLEIIRRFGNDILLIVSLDGLIVEANDRAAAAYGFPVEELLHLRLQDLRAEDTPSDVPEQLRAVVARGGMRFATWHRRRSGERFPVEVSARPLVVAGQAMVQSIIRDLSGEQAARAAIEREALLLEHLDDAVIGLDRELKVDAWNRAAERRVGLPRQDALGRALPTLFETEIPGGWSLAAAAQAAQAGGSSRLEIRLRARSGTWLDAEQTLMALRDQGGALVGYVAVLRDITVRKRAETALRASQERLTRVLETSNEGIWIVDALGRTEFVNERACELFGLSQGEVVGRCFVDVLPPALRPLAQEDLGAIRRGESGRRDLAHVRPDGQHLDLVSSRSILRGPDGRIAGAVSILVDVTAQRQAWSELVQAQKMEAVGRLASGVAHDFNNLLVSILTSSSFLADALAPDDPRREDAVTIHEAGERAARLVRQLLTFSRRSAANPVPTDLSAVIAGVEKLLRRTIGEDVRVETDLAPGLLTTRIDPGQLEQVVMNLAVNARDAMPGGGTLRISTRNEEGSAAAGAGREPGRSVALVIEDTGGGIAPEVLPRIFEPFFTTKQPGLGTGLGLSTVQGIVAQAHGRISVDSVPDRGTRFTIQLPACDEAAASAVDPGAGEGPRGRGERILLVEDDEIVRATVVRLLERSGYAVTEASNGREALERFRSTPDVALVLSDSVMPEGSGPALAAAIRESHRQVPVLLMSGYVDRESGPEPVLAKPFTAATLLSSVRSALGHRPAAR
jgi:PAS domain S-box-containing protein